MYLRGVRVRRENRREITPAIFVVFPGPRAPPLAEFNFRNGWINARLGGLNMRRGMQFVLIEHLRNAIVWRIPPTEQELPTKYNKHRLISILIISTASRYY